MKKALCVFAIPVVSLFSANLIAQTAPTSAADRSRSLEKRKALEENSLVKNIQFRNDGPSIMGGRVSDLEVNPQDPTEFYVAYASGGLWYTHNNGQSFTPVFDHEDVITIGDIAVNWKDRILWVGTGEVNSSRSSYAGNGVYKSTDSGKTWIYCGLPESHHIGAILLDPSDKNTAWVAATGHLYSPNHERGIYKTSDGGKNWKQVLYVDDNTGGIELQMDPADHSILYAAMWHRERRAWSFTESGSGSGIYKSEDGGEHWHLISGQGSGFPNGDNAGRIGLAVFPGNGHIVYAVIDNQAHKAEVKNTDTSVLTPADLKDITKDAFLRISNQKLTRFLKDYGFPDNYTAEQIRDSVAAGIYKPSVLTDFLNDANNSLFDTPVKGCEVYRSNDGGKSWNRMNDTTMDDVYYSYGYYFGKIFVSPQNADKIIVTGVVILQSDDGGHTWRSIDGENTHGDYHVVWIDPRRDSHLIIGNDGGVNITYDDGATWFKVNTPPVGQFYSVCVDDADPYNVYGGLQDNGIWCGPSDYSGGLGWTQEGQYPFTQLYGGDGMQVQVDTRNNNIVYAGFQFGYYARIDKAAGSASGIHPEGKLNEANLRFNWQTPIWLSRFNQDVLYYGTNRFYRSMDQGKEMEALSADLTNGAKKGDVPYGTITTIHESPMRFGLLYCGTDDGNVWISRDDGYTWKNISGKLPQGLWVSRVTAGAFREGRIYVSLNGYRYDNFTPYLFVSDDYGDTWTRLGNDLPDEPINVVKEDPVQEKILYVGTDNGLYVSLDGGMHFMAFSGGLPRVPVHDIAIQKRADDIVLGTHGRSIYIASLEYVQTLTDTLLDKDISLYPVKQITWNSNQGMRNEIFTDPVVYTYPFAYYVKAGGTFTVSVMTDSGNVQLFTGTDTAEAGINFFTWDLQIQDADTAAALAFFREAHVLKKAGNGHYYLPPGNYRFLLEGGKDLHASRVFVVIPSRKPGDSGEAPASLPDH